MASDDRFQKVQKDPRFWEMPERERKVHIDKRFRSMFHDKRFQVKQTVDKRGRPVSHSTAEDLRRFYHLSDSEGEEEGEGESIREEEDKKEKGRAEHGRAVKEVEQDDDDDDDDDDEEEHTEEDDEASDFEKPRAGVTKASSDDDDDEYDDDDDEEEGVSSGEEEQASEEEDSEPDLARGRGNLETSSDEDEEEEDDEAILGLQQEIEHDWGDLCKDAARGDQVSCRLAVCNMEWDRMKAKDLLALCKSFKPEDGVVLSVKIYPSEFGKERMRQEETQGPLELLLPLPEDPEEDTEEEKLHREKLRDYQFKRLRYFYAVVTCDSPETAAKIYQECDGFEYESSCSTLDLRFIPDDVTFKDEPRDEACDVDLSAYTPKLFTSSATAMSKVELTWDETDHDRVSTLNRKFNKEDLLDMDFNAYLASSSEEEEEEQPQEEEEAAVEQPGEGSSGRAQRCGVGQIERYRQILRAIQEKDQLQSDQGVEMEITWVPGLRETTEQLVQKKLEGADQLTPWEEYLQKKKDKRKTKRASKKQGAVEPDSDDDVPLDVDLSDPFFAEELEEGKKKEEKKKKKKGDAEKKTVEAEDDSERRKAEMTLLMGDEDDARHDHFNYDRIVELQNLSKKKRKKLLKQSEGPLEDDKFQVDVQDPRFQAMFTSHLFNLDPSDPGYRTTRGTHSIIQEKQRRREERQRCQEEEEEQGQGGAPRAPPAQQEVPTIAGKKSMDPGLSTLVKSVKSKTEQFQARKKQKTQ